jgi:RNA polymerase sigma-70 factor (ECF subfamily)
VDAREPIDHCIFQPSPEPATLGGVLYARPGGPLVAEAEWVALVRGMAAGEQSALHALYERAHRPVFTLAVRITSSHETAEEVTLDVFHDLWRRAAGYDPANGTVLGWIMNQARSRAIDRVRFESRQKRAAVNDPSAEAEAPDPCEILEGKRRRAAVRTAMAMLTPHERQAVGASFLSDLTHAEAARRLDAPLGTIKTRIRTALRKLRLAIGMEEP